MGVGEVQGRGLYPPELQGPPTPRTAPGGAPARGTAADRPAGVDLAATTGRSGGEDDLAKLRWVAQEFEAVFLGVLMRSMRATVPENELFGKSGASRLYRDLHDQEMARGLAGSGAGLGISDLIEAQFSDHIQSDGKAGPDGGLPAPVAGPIPTPEALLSRRGLAFYRQAGAPPVAAGQLAALEGAAGGLGGAVANTLQTWRGAIARAAADTAVDPGLLLAVMQVESGGDAAAISPRGAVGLMQLMPATAAELGVEARSPAENVLGGARYLQRMLARYAGRLDLALAAYNAGPGAVDRAGRNAPDYPETRRYVDDVLSLYRRLGRSGPREWHGSGVSAAEGTTTIDPESGEGP